MMRVYETSDGEKFHDERQAALHEAAIKAQRNLDDAVLGYGEAMAQSQKTADGYFYDVFCSKYYYVSTGWRGSPSISEIWFYRWNCQYGENGLVIKYEDREYLIGSLYKDRANARKALKLEVDRWLLNCIEQRDEIYTKYNWVKDK